jgi:hypothetical protein
MDHEVLDFPIMITKLEGTNMNQENPKPDPETKAIAEPRSDT